jgi:hypothetical protein
VPRAAIVRGPGGAGGRASASTSASALATGASTKRVAGSPARVMSAADPASHWPRHGERCQPACEPALPVVDESTAAS